MQSTPLSEWKKMKTQAHQNGKKNENTDTLSFWLVANFFDLMEGGTLLFGWLQTFST
jgi:hypothetical protein